jgi:hypothetical protein
VLQARWPKTKIPVMSERGERVGVNEALFREVNERIEGLQKDLGQPPRFEIVCECSDPGCVERFTITADEYAALRRDVHYFAVVPAHTEPGVERVVERHEDYLVVEKTDPDAAKAAEEMA